MNQNNKLRTKKLKNKDERMGETWRLKIRGWEKNK